MLTARARTNCGALAATMLLQRGFLARRRAAVFSVPRRRSKFRAHSRRNFGGLVGGSPLPPPHTLLGLVKPRSLSVVSSRSVVPIRVGDTSETPYVRRRKCSVALRGPTYARWGLLSPAQCVHASLVHVTALEISFLVFFDSASANSRAPGPPSPSPHGSTLPPVGKQAIAAAQIRERNAGSVGR